MRTRTVLRLSAVLALALGSMTSVAACGGDDAADDDTTFNCEADTRDEPFTANLARTGAGGVTFTIVSGDPVQLVRGTNTWTVDVSKDGQPVTGADATLKLTAFMPDHGHYAGVRAVWTPVAGTPGRYTVTPVNIWMPGIWEITLEVTPPGGTRDSVLFKFCLTA